MGEADTRLRRLLGLLKCNVDVGTLAEMVTRACHSVLTRLGWEHTLVVLKLR